MSTLDDDALRDDALEDDALEVSDRQLKIHYRVGSKLFCCLCGGIAGFFFVCFGSFLIWDGLTADDDDDSTSSRSAVQDWQVVGNSTCLRHLDCPGIAWECRDKACVLPEMDSFSSGVLLGCGITCSALAVYFGGVSGGCKTETVQISKQKAGWSLTIERKAWHLLPLSTARGSLAAGSFAKVEQLSHGQNAAAGHRAGGFTVIVEDGGGLDGVGVGGWQLWNGKPLRRGKAEELARKVNQFGIDPGAPGGGKGAAALTDVAGERSENRFTPLHSRAVAQSVQQPHWIAQMEQSIERAEQKQGGKAKTVPMQASPAREVESRKRPSTPPRMQQSGEGESHGWQRRPQTPPTRPLPSAQDFVLAKRSVDDSSAMLAPPPSSHDELQELESVLAQLRAQLPTMPPSLQPNAQEAAREVVAEIERLQAQLRQSPPPRPMNSTTSLLTVPALSPARMAGVGGSRSMAHNTEEVAEMELVRQHLMALLPTAVDSVKAEVSQALAELDRELRSMGGQP